MVYTIRMSSIIHITKPEARRFLVRYHGLDGAASWEGADGIMQCFERLGAIQYDPLDVVGRNPDLVLQARIAGYRRGQIDELLYRERLLVDQWDKQMSIHQTAEWAHRTRLRTAYAEAVHHWLRHYRNSEAALEILDAVLAALAEKGPVLPARLDFGAVPNHSGWGSRKVAGVALEYLAARGEVGIHSRRNTQKIYALIGDLLPPEVLNAAEPFADEHEFLLWYALRRVEAVGLAANRSGGTWLVNLLDSTPRRTPLLEELVEQGRLLRIAVDGSRERLYMPARYRRLLETSEERERRVRFLAPLDNMLFDRKLVATVFGFEYSWEVYVSEAKRRYGYYVLPVLYGDELIARFEPELHRGDAPLVIKNWWWEPGVRRTPELRRAITAAKRQFHTFLTVKSPEVAAK